MGARRWMTGLLAGLLSAALLVLGSAPAGARDRSTAAGGWTPIAGSAGWSACAPISWSIDPGALAPAQARRQVPALAWAFDQWSRASGLRFVYTGVTPTSFDAATADLHPRDGLSRDRHIYLTWLTPGSADALAGRTSGFGAPSAVVGSDITAGRAVFKAGYVASTSRREPAKARALYLHELGHVLGLGHSSARSDRMYPIVDAGTSLGRGDVAGIRALTRGC